MTVLDEPPTPRLDPTGDPQLAALSDAVRSFLASPSAVLPEETALERLRVLLPLIEQLKVAALGGLRDVDTRELYQLDGAGSAAGWMRMQPVAPDGITVTVARGLDRLPVAAAEAVAGRMSVRDVSTIAAALAKVPADVSEVAVVNVLCDGIGQTIAEVRGGDTPDAHEVRAGLAAIAMEPTSAPQRLEEGFVVFARQIATALPAGYLRRHLDAFVDALTPEQHDDRDRTLHDDRHLDLTPVLDGGWHVRGLLDAETGQALYDALERFTAPTKKDEDGRTAAQKRHDALRELCAFSAAHPEAPKAKGVAREIVVYARKETLERQPGGVPGRLRSGMRLSPTTLDRMSCGALFTPLLLDDAGQPLKVGRSRRLHTRAQRTALQVLWGGSCAGEGCGTAGTIPHHVIPWSEGGATDLDSAVLLCESTHHDLHTGRKHIKLKDGRLIGPLGPVDGPADGPSP